MSEFKANTDGIRGVAKHHNRPLKCLNQVEDEILQIQNSLSFEIAQKQQIRQRLKRARNNVSSHIK